VSPDCIELQKRLEKTEAIISALYQGELDAIVRSGDIALIRNEKAVRNTEYALEETRKNFQLLFDTLDDLLFIIDTIGKIIHFNIAVPQYLGYTSQELLSMNFLDLHQNEDHSQVCTLLKGQVRLIQNVMLKKNGTILYAETRFSKGVWSRQPVWFVIVRDISIRKQAELEMQEARKAAEKADQEKTEFFANMTHELRTPLNGILGYSQLLKKDKQLNDTHQKAVSVIHNSGEYLLNLINDLLDFSTIEAHKMKIYMEIIQLMPILQYISEMGAIQAKQKNINFCVNMPDKIPETINTDEKRLQQILLNLVGNGIKFTDHGHVHFSVQIFQTSIRFCIEDTGCGIDISKQKTIFQAFNRIKNKNEQKEGTGLGLYISQKLLKMMKSNLNIESKMGEGTKVWFDLNDVILSNKTQDSLPVSTHIKKTIEHKTITYPPVQMLNTVLDLTMAGDVNGIFEWIEMHQKANPAYESFFQMIKEMASSYKITDIQQMIENFFSNQSTK
jgi:PAS domain S-box-containing protein